MSTLIEVVAKGGNLVLGVGPTPEGLIQQEVIQRLKVIGEWLHIYGKAIYGTTITGHYNDGNIWFTANKDGKHLYAIYALKDRGKVPRTISWTVNIPKSVRLLSTGKVLTMVKSNKTVTVTLPANMKEESFALQLDM